MCVRENVYRDRRRASIDTRRSAPPPQRPPRIKTEPRPSRPCNTAINGSTPSKSRPGFPNKRPRPLLGTAIVAPMKTITIVIALFPLVLASTAASAFVTAPQLSLKTRRKHVKRTATMTPHTEKNEDDGNWRAYRARLVKTGIHSLDDDDYQLTTDVPPTSSTTTKTTTTYKNHQDSTTTTKRHHWSKWARFFSPSPHLTCAKVSKSSNGTVRWYSS